MTAVAFDNVHKTYPLDLLRRRSIVAVRGVSLSIPTGSATALLGPNRAGKTTLIKMLLSLTRPTQGHIQRLGNVVSDRQTLRRVGYMHENHAFPRYLNPADVLHFYGGLTGLRTEELPAKVDMLLDKVGLADRRHDSISGFSKGMVQRLGLAQAIINEPDLLILDEPTEGLDLFGRKLLRDVVREQKKAGKTTIFVSHVLPEVAELCDRAAVIVGGELAFDGPLAELQKGRELETALQMMYERGVAA